MSSGDLVFVTQSHLFTSEESNTPRALFIITRPVAPIHAAKVWNGRKHSNIQHELAPAKNDKGGGEMWLLRNSDFQGLVMYAYKVYNITLTWICEPVAVRRPPIGNTNLKYTYCWVLV
jgi:hypothetical protein